MFERWRVKPSTKATSELEKAQTQLLDAENKAIEVHEIIKPLAGLRKHNHLGERVGLAYAAERRRKG